MPFDFAPVETDSVVLALMRAKARIADPKDWCRGTLARNAAGRDLMRTAATGEFLGSALDDEAVSWCALGALCVVRQTRHLALDEGVIRGSILSQAQELLDDAAYAAHSVDTAEVNDEIGHDAVMDLFDAAIDKARAIALRRAEEARRG